MGSVDIVSYMTQALYLVLWLSLPPIAVASIVGVLFSLFQALTQIQEMTLTFVPKLLIMGVVMLMSLPMIGEALSGFMAEISVRIIGG